MTGIIAVNDLDIISVMNLVAKRKRRYAAIMLNDIEEIWTGLGLSLDHPSFKLLRKSVLDNINELARAWLRDITGEVEDDYGVI